MRMLPVVMVVALGLLAGCKRRPQTPCERYARLNVGCLLGFPGDDGQLAREAAVERCKETLRGPEDSNLMADINVRQGLACLPAAKSCEEYKACIFKPSDGGTEQPR